MNVKVEAGAEISKLTATSSSEEIDVRLEKEKADGQYSLVVTPEADRRPADRFHSRGNRREGFESVHRSRSCEVTGLDPLVRCL
jgi:hypothetical protein